MAHMAHILCRSKWCHWATTRSATVAPRRCKSLLEVGLLDPEGLDDPWPSPIHKGKVLKQGVSEEEINEVGQNPLKTNKDWKNVYKKIILTIT